MVMPSGNSPLSDADRARIRAEEEERLRVRAELQNLPAEITAKKPPAKKRPGLAIAFFAIIVLAVVATPKNKDSAVTATEPPVLETNVGPTTPLPPSTDAPAEGTPVPLPSATDVSTPAADKSAPVADDSIPTLPGGERYDVTAGLSKPPYDFVFTDPTYGTYGATYTGKSFDTDTGADLTVTVDATSGHIYALRAYVTGADLRAAQWLLPYIASLPFDANDTAESKKWTLSNIGKVRDQHPIERTAYGAKWSLRGNGTSISLSITPEGLDAWSGRQK